MLFRDDPLLEANPDNGTWSPYLVGCIEAIAANDRYLSDRVVLYPFDVLMLSTREAWPEREEA